MLKKHFVSVIGKFNNYGHCRKVFITEAFGDIIVINHKLLEMVISNMEVPDCIDEIWIEFPKWLNDNDSVPAYSKVK